MAFRMICLSEYNLLDYYVDQLILLVTLKLVTPLEYYVVFQYLAPVLIGTSWFDG